MLPRGWAKCPSMLCEDAIAHVVQEVPGVGGRFPRESGEEFCTNPKIILLRDQMHLYEPISC